MIQKEKMSSLGQLVAGKLMKLITQLTLFMAILLMPVNTLKIY